MTLYIPRLCANPYPGKRGRNRLNISGLLDPGHSRDLLDGLLNNFLHWIFDRLLHGFPRGRNQLFYRFLNFLHRGFNRFFDNLDRFLDRFLDYLNGFLDRFLDGFLDYLNGFLHRFLDGFLDYLNGFLDRFLWNQRKRYTHLANVEFHNRRRREYRTGPGVEHHSMKSDRKTYDKREALIFHQRPSRSLRATGPNRTLSLPHSSRPP